MGVAMTERAEGGASRVAGTERDVALYDLRSRTFRAASRLREMAEDAVGDERRRLVAKAQGVELAMSYLDEVLRDVPK